jgi:MFS family permease
MGQFQYRVLLAAGLCFMADAVEILLLSFLSIVLKQQWGLQVEQVALITTSVFLGALVGTLVMGHLGDKWGRKPVFMFTASVICFFGVITAGTHHFITFVCIRFFVGCGVGGLTVPFDTLAEFVPTSHRGQILMAIEYFWTVGSLLTTLVAYWTFGQDTVNDYDWRIFILICSLPCFVSVWMGWWYVPESPRWLLTQPERAHEALIILREAAVINQLNPDMTFPPNLQLHDPEANPAEQASTVCDLLTPAWRRRLTLHLWATWAGQAFVYYGTIFVITLVFASSAAHHENAENVEDSNKGSYPFDYKAIFVAGSAEFIGTTIALHTIDKYGRIPSQVISYAVGGVLVWLLCMLKALLVDPPRFALIVVAFGARLAFMCASCTTWVSTAEMLTTDIRTTGHAAANAIARLGGSAFPFIVTERMPFWIIGTTILCVSISTSLNSWCLPETAGRTMGTNERSSRSLSRISILSSSRYQDVAQVDGIVETTALQNNPQHHHAV